MPKIKISARSGIGPIALVSVMGLVLFAQPAIAHHAFDGSIVGAEMTPLVAYLAGFTIVQLIVAPIAYKIGKFWMQKFIEQPLLNLRFAGFTICGAGAAFPAGAILG